MKFVLVHGAWQTGGSWNEVRSALESNGHEVHTPTAAGLRDGDTADVGLADAVAPISEYIVSNDLRDFVLVGHSWGGSLIAALATEHADRVRRLVFHNAFVPLDGESILDNTPPFFRPALTANSLERGDGTVVLPFPVWRDGFMNDADLELAEQSYAQLRPQPLRTLTESTPMQAFFALEIPKSYLYATDDNGILQGEWGFHPRMSNRLGYFRLVQMPGGHQVMHTNPELLARKLVEAGRD